MSTQAGVSRLIPSTHCEAFTSSCRSVCYTRPSSEDTHIHSFCVVLLSLDPEFCGALTTQH